MSALDRNAADGSATCREQGEEKRAEGHGYTVLMLLLLLGVGVRVNRAGLTGFISLSEGLVLLAAALIVVHALLHPRRCIIRIDRPTKYLAGFLLWGAFSQYWALRPDAVPEELIAIALKAMIYTLVLTCTITRRALDWWTYLFIFMSFGFMASAYHEGVIVGGFRAAAEAAGGSQWLTIFGFWSSFLLMLNIHSVLFGRGSMVRTFAGLGLLANLFTLYLIDQRAPLLVIPIQLIIYVILFGKHRKTILAAAVLVVMALAVLVIRSPRFAERVMLATVDVSAMARGEEAVHGTLRYLQYQISIECIRENYLVGVGLGSFRYWADEVYGWRVFWSHSLILRITAELGIPGLLLFGAFVLSALSRGWSTCRELLQRRELPEASLIAALICGAIGLVMYAQLQPMLKEMPVYLSLSLLSAAAALHGPAKPDGQTSESARSDAST